MGKPSLSAAKHHVHSMFVYRYAAVQPDLLYILVNTFGLLQLSLFMLSQLPLPCCNDDNIPSIPLQHVRPRQCKMVKLPSKLLNVDTMCAGRHQHVLQAALAH